MHMSPAQTDVPSSKVKYCMAYLCSIFQSLRFPSKNINVSFCPTKKKVSKTCNPDSPFFSRERNQEKVWCFALIKLFNLCHVQMFEEKRSILGYFLAGGGNTCYLATGISVDSERLS